MSDSPRFSILIPAYNAADLITETLTSVSDQTLPDWECIVVDDGSTDDTAAFVERAAADDSRFRLVRQDNLGTAGALNTAGAAARGGYHVMLGADDLLLPDFLTSQDAFMRAHPGFDIYACNSTLLLADGRRIPLWRDSRADTVFSLTPRDQIRESSIVAMTVFHKRLWELTGGFRSIHSEDYDFWLRAMLAGATHIYNPVTLSVYRRREGTKTRALVKEAESFLWIVEDAARRPDLSGGDCAALDEAIEFGHARVGRRRFEEALLDGRFAHARAEYWRWRLAFPAKGQYVLGLAIMLVSPRLYARFKTRRMI